MDAGIGSAAAIQLNRMTRQLRQRVLPCLLNRFGPGLNLASLEAVPSYSVSRAYRRISGHPDAIIKTISFPS
jgi:hypothetical protein